MNNENCEPRIRFTAQRGRQGFELILPRLHVFLAHTHPGGWVASGYIPPCAPPLAGRERATKWRGGDLPKAQKAIVNG